MKLKNFISQYVNHNALVRLWTDDDSDWVHNMVTCGEHQTGMAWKILNGIGFQAPYAECEVKYVTDIICENDRDAVSIVIELPGSEVTGCSHMSENRCVCCGEIIPEGRQVCKRCESGTGNNVGTKTADQMFRELGYKKIKSVPQCSISYDFVYFNRKENQFIGVEVVGNSILFECAWNKGTKNSPKWARANYTDKEILACAQLIKEMEAGGNG